MKYAFVNRRIYKVLLCFYKDQYKNTILTEERTLRKLEGLEHKLQVSGIQTEDYRGKDLNTLKQEDLLNFYFHNYLKNLWKLSKI